MSIRLTIISGGKSDLIETEYGDTLLKILRDKAYSVYAPCGGRGICGKCTVNVKGKGKIRSCTFYPERDLEISLPETGKAVILTSQSLNLEEMPFEKKIKQPFTTKPFGVAVDIGTTTVVMYFLDMLNGKTVKTSSFLNPQKTFGADVITRIEYCQKNRDGLKELQTSLIKEINKYLDDFTEQMNCSQENIEIMAFAGNTTMLHILLGEDPVPIALAPFTPKFTDKQIRRAINTRLSINPDGSVITLPFVSAYVGSDIVAGLSALKDSHTNYLYVDIGTNGEIALVNKDRIFMCSTAAGPAFEGSNISCGMAAVSGAISAYPGFGRYEVIGNTEPSGICGSGILDIVAYLLVNNLIDETGLMKEPFIVYPENDIKIIQDDIREIQLAKSAIYSGIRVLMNLAGLTFNDVEALFLAGGFGNYIRTDSALLTGLLPGELKDRIYPVGNSAGFGVLQYLRSEHFGEKINRILRKTKYIELSGLDEFTTEFALNMDFRTG